MRVKLTISYDGTAYCGWQIQPNGITVQEIINNAILNLTGEKVNVRGSGRTDAGVHAKGQVAHFDTKSSIPPEKFAKALNTLLPPDIRVEKSQKAKDNFDACRSAKRKTYEYSMYQSEIEDPLKERYAIRVNVGLDLNKMRLACKMIEGEHDFKSFCSSGSGAQTTIRTVYSCKVISKGKDVKIVVSGNGFLYNMVRIIAGTLVKIGYGKMQLEDLAKMLEGKNRSLGGDTFPPRALCLKSVGYN